MSYSKSYIQCVVTFSADAGAVHWRAGCMIVAGAGGHAARSVQAGRADRRTVLTLACK